MLEFDKILNEKKNKSTGLRFRPTIYKLLKLLAKKDNKSINEKLESYVIKEYIESISE